jgi:hypothetical protein
LDGQVVLKTIDHNGQATWNEEYWVLGKDGPIHLDVSTLYKDLGKVIPKNSQLDHVPLNLNRDCFRMYVWQEDGAGGSDKAVCWQNLSCGEDR